MRTLFCAVALAACAASGAQDGWKFVWGDEFERDGRPDPSKWAYETGFVRNNEDQWYQPENAYCSNGWLVIEARHERKPSPAFRPGAKDWAHSRTNIELTSACVITKGKRNFTYGRIDIRARFTAEGKLWPALWLLGDDIASANWPACGEIDILEYFNDSVLANFCWADNKWGFGDGGVPEKGRGCRQKWNTGLWRMSHFLERDPDWASKWHVWSIVRTEELITITLDGELLNVQANGLCRNPKGRGRPYPFRGPMYLLMNLAIRDHEYDSKVPPRFPSRFLIDYVRAYEHD